MRPAYFERVREATGTRFWVNNPTMGEVENALRHGAMGCTTNPAFAAGLLGRAPGEIEPIIDACVASEPDDLQVANHVQELLVARIAGAFLPLYDRSAGREGFASIQGAPGSDADADEIVREARHARSLGPNVTPKLPATHAGLDALDILVADDSPVIVTEVFSVAQVIAVCERWLAAAGRSGRRPPFFMSPITGIFSDYLRGMSDRHRRSVPDDAIGLAGVLVARACHRVVRERGYPVGLLFGGSRSTRDFTGLVGDGMAATINWTTAATLLDLDPEILVTIHDAVDPATEASLRLAFTDVARALEPGAIAPADFATFGPVSYFRDAFVGGWETLVGAIRSRRAAPTATGR